jgi:CTP synthase (UTP-ammonia lyase)
VYKLIRWCREKNFPLLGTCAGFQYMAVEYARNVLRLSNANHQESEPGSPTMVITKLNCSLKGVSEEVFVTDRQSWLYKVLNKEKIIGQFNCSYGVNPVYQSVLHSDPFVFTAFSLSGEPRAVELKTHRFFNGTLFQPPLDSSPGNPNPLVMDFLKQVRDLVV